MQLELETIGKFIDASVNDHSQAERLLVAHPELRNAKWIGDEHLLNFLVIENFLDGVSFASTADSMPISLMVRWAQHPCIMRAN